MNKKVRFGVSVGTVLVLLMVAGVAAADGHVNPPSVEATLFPGESIQVDKWVTTPAIPPMVDICLLEDETGSFGDDIANLQALAPALVAALDASGSNYATCVLGFRDFAQSNWGSSGDWVYRRLSDVAPGGGSLLAGVAALSAAGGADTPEAQLEALHYLAVPGHAAIDSNGDSDTVDANDTAAGLQPTWRAGSQRVVLLATDAGCHVTGDAGGWPGDGGTTGPAVTGGILSGAGITVIGLTPGGAGTIGCVDTLAASTGGSVHATTASGATIVEAVLAGLEELTTDVWWELGTCDAGIIVRLLPDVSYDVAGDTPVFFREWIAVPDETALGDYHCTVTFIANEYPAEGEEIGRQEIWISVPRIDIKPGSDPNGVSVNPKGKGGTIPVAILSTDLFDATTMVDPSTVALSDSGTAGACTTTKSAEDVNGDGLLDQVYHCENEPRIFQCGDTVGILTGEYVGGGAFAAKDSVKPAPCK